MSQTAPASQPAHPGYAKLARRFAIAFLSVMLSLITVAILMLLTSEPAAASWAPVAGIIGLAGTAAGGWRVGVLAVAFATVMAPICIVAGQSPFWGALVMAFMCIITGASSRVGLHRVFLLVPVFMAWMILSPPVWGPDHVVDRTNPTYLIGMAFIFLVGGLVPALVAMPMLQRAQIPSPQPHPRRDSLPYTITITILTSVATFVLVQDTPNTTGAWLIATILILTQVGNVGTVKMTLQRIIGTVLGVAVVFVVVAIVQSDQSVAYYPLGQLLLLYGCAFLLLLFAIVAKFGPHYWLYFSLMTPTVIIFTTPSVSDVGSLAEERAAYNGIGVALVLLSMVITMGFTRWENARGNGPTQDVPRVAGDDPVAAPTPA